MYQIDVYTHDFDTLTLDDLADDLAEYDESQAAEIYAIERAFSDAIGERESAIIAMADRHIQ